MYLIGVAGGSGSGKTTFAKKILAHVMRSYPTAGPHPVALLHQDSYYLPSPPDHLYVHGKPNFDHPDSFDWALLRNHLSLLRKGEIVEAPTYDYRISRRTSQTETMGPCKVILFDGIFALWDLELRGLLDLKVYLNVEADIRFIRRLHRDVRERGRSLDGIVKQYYDTVRPMHREYLEPTQQYADLVVGEETEIAAEVVAAQIIQVIKS